MAREAAKVAEEVAYERGVEETEIRLAEEVARVCKDYCTETWTEALNNVEVPTDSKLRKAESIFSLEHIREALADLLPTTALPFPPPEQASNIQDLTVDAEISTGAGKGKEALPSDKDTHSKDALTIKDVVFQVKEAESKFEAGDAKLKATDSKKGSQPTKK